MHHRREHWVVFWIRYLIWTDETVLGLPTRDIYTSKGVQMRALFANTSLAAMLLGMAALFHGADAAQLKGFAWLCGEQKQICYWHMTIVAPPKGWATDEAWTKRYKAVV